jgi:hypothetical protein
MARWFRWLVLMALLGLAVCATRPAVPFDRSTANIKTIGILTPAFPAGPKVVLASTVGQSFGLIGALIDAGMQANRDATFTSMLASQRFSAPDAFSAALAQAVKSEGYAVEMIPVTRDTDDLLTDYHVATNIKVDAYLDVAVAVYGYVAAGIGDAHPYRPVLGLYCRLVRAADGTVLMQDTVAYNPVNPRGNIITISPDPTYTFVDFDSLASSPQQSEAGLEDAVARSAQSVAKLLH